MKPTVVSCPRCWTRVDLLSLNPVPRYYASCTNTSCRAILELPGSHYPTGADHIDQENCRYCGTMKEIGTACPNCGRTND